MLYFASHGFRAIAHVRRGHGRCSQKWDGNTMNQYADDLAELFEQLDLEKAITLRGGCEVARYLGCHGTKRVAKAVLLSAVLHIMLKRPNDLPIEVFDVIRQGVMADRMQFFKYLTTNFFGANP
jgi:non-heme chloroperoxidase